MTRKLFTLLLVFVFTLSFTVVGIGANNNENTVTNAVYNNEDEYELTINVEGEGSKDPEEGTHTYEAGEKVTVEASPEEGWYFVEWSGDIESTEEKYTFEMDEDKEITAVFEELVEEQVLWKGHGSEELDNLEDCHLIEYHWVLTPGGNYDVSGAMLHVEYEDGTTDEKVMEAKGTGEGAAHAYVEGPYKPVEGETYAYFDDDRKVSENAILTISDAVCIEEYPEEGELIVSKEVTGDEAEYYEDETFEYTVYHDDNDELGEPVNNLQDVTIEDGEENIHELEFGKYWIIETENHGADEVYYNNEPNGDGYDFQITETETTYTVNIENRFDEVIPPEEGELTVSKEVTGDAAEDYQDRTFEYTVYYDDNGELGNPVNNLQDVNIEDGEENNHDLEFGDYWIVEPETHDADEVTYNNETKEDGYQFEITEDETTYTVNIENRFDEVITVDEPPTRRRPTPPTPDPKLTIEKELLDEQGEEITEDDTEFTVILTGGDFEEDEFTISVDEPKVLGPEDGLELDIEYTIQEKAHEYYEYLEIEPEKMFELTEDENEITLTVVNQHPLLVEPEPPEVEPEPPINITLEKVWELDEEGEIPEEWEVKAYIEDEPVASIDEDKETDTFEIYPGETYRVEEYGIDKEKWEIDGIGEEFMAPDEDHTHTVTNIWEPVEPLVEPEPPVVEPEPEPEVPPLPVTGTSDFLRIGLGMILAGGGLLLKKRKIK